MQSCGLTRFTTDLSNTKLSTLDLWGNQLNEMPSANLLPATLESLDLTGNLFTDVDNATAASYAKMTALKTLRLEGVPFIIFPSGLIKNLPAANEPECAFWK